MNKVTKVRVKQDGAFGEEMPLGVDASNVMLEEGKDLETKLKEFVSSGESLTISEALSTDFNNNQYLKSGIYCYSASYPAQKPENGPDYDYYYPGVLIVLEEGAESVDVAPNWYIVQIFITNGYVYTREVFSINFARSEVSYGTWEQIYPNENVIRKAIDKADALAKSKTDTSTIYYWAE